jgi:hypothetical protein
MDAAQLMSHFKFDATDLAANRAGRFSPRQVERIKGREGTRRLGRFAGGMVPLAVAAASVVFAVFFLLTNHDPESGPEMGIAFGVIVPLIFGFFGVRSLLKAARHREMRLAVVQGVANIKVAGGYNAAVQVETKWTELRIGGLKFVEAASLANAMVSGREYKVYYIDGLDELRSAIVSAEAM